MIIAAINVFEEFDATDEQRMTRVLTVAKPQFHVLKGNKAIIKAFGYVHRIPNVLVFNRHGNAVLYFIYVVGGSRQVPGQGELENAVQTVLAKPN